MMQVCHIWCNKSLVKSIKYHSLWKWLWFWNIHVSCFYKTLIFLHSGYVTQPLSFYCVISCVQFKNVVLEHSTSDDKRPSLVECAIIQIIHKLFISRPIIGYRYTICKRPNYVFGAMFCFYPLDVQSEMMAKVTVSRTVISTAVESQQIEFETKTECFVSQICYFRETPLF